ncbi:hypothetical protein [uncultured Treponema sp.]|nr:hypothetical protein [uncultured Treponema sp.]
MSLRDSLVRQENDIKRTVIIGLAICRYQICFSVIIGLDPIIY